MQNAWRATDEASVPTGTDPNPRHQTRPCVGEHHSRLEPENRDVRDGRQPKAGQIPTLPKPPRPPAQGMPHPAQIRSDEAARLPHRREPVGIGADVQDDNLGADQELERLRAKLDDGGEIAV